MWPNPQFPADLDTLTEEILNGKRHFLCSACKTNIIRYIITMYNTSVINIHTTPSNELVLFWLLCVSVVLMISPKVFTIYILTITIKMVSLIATNASIDPISFIIYLITPTSTMLIISSMITLISAILKISLMITSISTKLIISMIISISIILIISLFFFSFLKNAEYFKNSIILFGHQVTLLKKCLMKLAVKILKFLKNKF